MLHTKHYYLLYLNNLFSLILERELFVDNNVSDLMNDKYFYDLHSTVIIL